MGNFLSALPVDEALAMSLFQTYTFFFAVVVVDQMIRSMIKLAHSMERFWDCIGSVIKEIPQKEQWKRNPSVRKRSDTLNAGFARTLSKRLEKTQGKNGCNNITWSDFPLHAAIRRISAYEPTADCPGNLIIVCSNIIIALGIESPSPQVHQLS